MSRGKTNFVSAVGIWFEVSKTLLNAIIDAGGGDADVRRLGDKEVAQKVAGFLLGLGRTDLSTGLDIDSDTGSRQVVFQYFTMTANQEDFRSSIDDVRRAIHRRGFRLPSQIEVDTFLMNQRPACATVCLSMDTSAPPKGSHYTIVKPDGTTEERRHSIYIEAFAPGTRFLVVKE